MTETTTPGVRIGDVVVTDRARKDLGVLDDLMDSISSLGLLHPVVVDRGNELIAGQRRLEACRRLGWAAVPFVVADNIDDAATKLAAERDENRCRKDMTWSELADLGARIEDLERPKAKERQRDGGDRGRESRYDDLAVDHAIHSQPPAETSKNRAADRTAEALGTSRASMQRAQVVTNAARGAYRGKAISEEARRVAEEALEQMNATGTIQPAWEKVKKAVAPEPRPLAASNGKRTAANKAPVTAKKQRDVVTKSTYSLAGIAYGLSQITELADEITADEARQWEKDFARNAKELGRFRQLLKERSCVQA